MNGEEDEDVLRGERETQSNTRLGIGEINGGGGACELALQASRRQAPSVSHSSLPSLVSQPQQPSHFFFDSQGSGGVEGGASILPVLVAKWAGVLLWCACLV